MSSESSASEDEGSGSDSEMYEEYTDLAGQELLFNFTLKTDQKDRENEDAEDVDMSPVDEEQIHEAFDALVNEELGLLQPVRKGEEMLHNEHADTDTMKMDINPKTGKLEGKRIGPTDPLTSAKIIRKIQEDPK